MAEVSTDIGIGALNRYFGQIASSELLQASRQQKRRLQRCLVD
jgi:hypothetical protein